MEAEAVVVPCVCPFLGVRVDSSEKEMLKKPYVGVAVNY
jgi:hypothetical protein